MFIYILFINSIFIYISSVLSLDIKIDVFNTNYYYKDLQNKDYTFLSENINLKKEISAQDGLSINSISGYSSVILDGVKLNDPTTIMPFFSLSSIPNIFIQKANILPGGYTSIYGTGTANGLLNISTKRLQSNIIYINAYKGNLNTSSVNFATNLNYNTLNISLFGSNFYTQGYSLAKKNLDNNKNTEKDSKKIDNFALKINYNANDYNETNLFFNLSNSKINYDGYTYENPTPIDEKNYYSISYYKIFYLQHLYKFKNIDNNIILSYFNINRYYNEQAFSYKYQGSIYTINYNNKININRFIYLQSGYLYELQKDLISSNNYLSNNDGFLSINEKLFDSFLFSQSARFNIYNYRNKFLNNYAYTFNTKYNINSLSFIFFNYGIGYNNPSLYMLSNIYSGNLLLNAEKTYTTNISLVNNNAFAWFTSQSIEFNIFKIKNAITYDNKLLKYINDNNKEYYSINLSNTITINNNIKFTTYYYITLNNTNNNFAKHFITNSLLFSKNNWHIEFQNIASKGNIEYVNNTTKKLLGYSIFNANINYKNAFNKVNYNIYFNIDNIFNKSYETSYGYNNKPLSFYFGINMQLN